MVTMGISGPIADRANPKILVLIMALCYCGAELLSPLLADWSYYALLPSRVFMGLIDVGSGDGDYACFFS